MVVKFNFKEQRIIVVEDDLATSQTIIAMLDELGYKKVKAVYDGRQALEALSGNEKLFDVIFCDWNMPNMTGIELLRQIRTIDYGLPFFMITARGDVESVKEAADLNVTAYIRKPFSLEEIDRKLKNVLDRTSHR